MTISYSEAINLLQEEAQLHSPELKLRTEPVPLHLAINRISTDTICSSRSTPLWDTSAMDGYALSSRATKYASAENPISFPVKGLIAAGKELVSNVARTDCQHLFCVEIMTGARFPDAERTCGVEFDCCVKFEDVKRMKDPTTGEVYIQVSKSVPFRQNRRLAGQDFKSGSVIVTAGETIQPRHIMALASVGIREIPVQPELRIGLYSTGSELLSHPGSQSDKSKIEDINGPYLVAALTETIQADVHFLGILDDQVDTITNTIRKDIDHHRFDIIITTGAVSAGRFDLIPAAVEKLRGRIVFHKLGMRPGHPALFATIPSKSSNKISTEIPFFGLPGNPIASAACLRFLVLPYISFLQSGNLETPLKARLTRAENNVGGLASQPIASFPHGKDVFRAGVLNYSPEGRPEVVLIADHSPGKVRPFLEANCWIHFHAGQSEVMDGDNVDVFPDV